MLAGLANSIAATNKNVIFLHVPTFIASLSSHFENNSLNKEIKRVSECDVLILDDIGAENTTEAVRSMLVRIADGRLGKWTLWTSNLLSDDIGKTIDVRIASRMYRGDNVVCEVENAPDYCFERKRRLS